MVKFFCTFDSGVVSTGIQEELSEIHQVKVYYILEQSQSISRPSLVDGNQRRRKASRGDNSLALLMQLN